MRIIPDNVHVSYAVIDQGQNYSSGNPMYHQDQTIEITDEELVLIITWFMDRDSEYYMSEFPRCLRELIELKRTKS